MAGVCGFLFRFRPMAGSHSREEVSAMDWHGFIALLSHVASLLF